MKVKGRVKTCSRLLETNETRHLSAMCDSELDGSFCSKEHLLGQQLKHDQHLWIRW